MQIKGRPMKDLLIGIMLTGLILPVAGEVEGGKEKQRPKAMRIYAAQCSDVIGPLRAQLEERGYSLVSEDVADDGGIEMEMTRQVKMSKWRSRGLVTLDQDSGQCTVTIKLEEKDPIFGWQSIRWNEKKFYRPLDEKFPEAR
jgi:hypothetical protein